MTTRTLYRIVCWTIALVALFVWMELIFVGGENIAFQNIFSNFSCLLVLWVTQSFLKWKILTDEQLKENLIYEQSVVRELNYLKDELGWNGNENLEKALKRVTEELSWKQVP